MRALITGISGFTGRYVAAELEQAGWEVFGFGSNPAEGRDRYFQIDLADDDRLRKTLADIQPQLVIHLAAIAFVGHGSADAFYTTNLIGSRNLLDAIASAAEPECVILASSANVYGNTTEGTLPETTLPNPANDYAVSKIAMEYMAHTWMNRLPLLITRPFNYTGVGQAENFLLPKIVAHFRARADSIELGNLDVWRDFSDVRAVAEAYRRLAEKRPVGQIFNLASGRTYSLREIVGLCETITGHAIDLRVNPAFVRANEVRSLCGDPARLRAAIGDWSSPPLESTLRWMLEA